MHTINDLPNFTVKLADKCHIREFCDHKLTGAGKQLTGRGFGMTGCWPVRAKRTSWKTDKLDRHG